MRDILKVLKIMKKDDLDVNVFMYAMYLDISL